MRGDRTYVVYILASGHYGTLYIGVTNDIYRRMLEHRAGKGSSFTRKYNVTRLVYMEAFGFNHRCDPPREAAETLAARVEDQPDRTGEPHWSDLFVGLRRFGSRRPTAAQVDGWVLGTRASRSAKDDTA